ncbi:hypothetical protein ACOQFO_06820 [Ureibacillus sp. MALMAid1270]|uniref:hypothetical protein n=1 Tax=Ureibacillus sp. MALMAid1270 TaxID=3411629 RepID=UPI003BA7CBD5
MGFTTISFPVVSSVSAENTFIKNSPVNMIKQTDSELIYEIEVNGEILRYEEQIKENNNKTKIETKVYKLVDGKKKLVDNSKKEIIKTESQVEFIKNWFYENIYGEQWIATIRDN